jgi:hypothetical protein
MAHDGLRHPGGGEGATRAAVERARTTLGLDAGEPVRAWHVSRTQPGARDYVLIIFGIAGRASAIAAVDVASHEVLESTRLPPNSAHSLIDASEAIALAGVEGDAKTRLVWDPSSASRSRFYPLWEIEHAGRTVWVDSVTGSVWRKLDAERGGA